MEMAARDRTCVCGADCTTFADIPRGHFMIIQSLGRRHTEARAPSGTNRKKKRPPRTTCVIWLICVSSYLRVRTSQPDTHYLGWGRTSSEGDRSSDYGRKSQLKDRLWYKMGKKSCKRSIKICWTWQRHKRRWVWTSNTIKIKGHEKTQATTCNACVDFIFFPSCMYYGLIPVAPDANLYQSLYSPPNIIRMVKERRMESADM